MGVRPPLDLGYLRLLTDDTGVIQHAFNSVPNRATGYTTDDNARALLVAVQEYERSGSPEALRLATVYLAFLCHALTPEGRIHNLMSYDRRWLDARGSEDCHGRALWAAGYVASAAVPRQLRLAAHLVYAEALPWAARLRSPRAAAYSLVGIWHYLRGHPGEEPSAALAASLADQLVAAHARHRSSEWEWFEDVMAYANGILPYALFMASALTGEERYRQVARVTLEFLTQVTLLEGVLQPIGCHGWYERSRSRAWFDQQPIDAQAMVLAYLSAWEVLGCPEQRERAEAALDWFFGRNALRCSLICADNGGCYDGLTPGGVNENQGAESQAAYLLAYLAAIRAGLADGSGS